MAKQYARLGAKAASFYSSTLRFKLLPGEIKEFPDKAMMDGTFMTALGNGHIRIATPEEVEAYMKKMGQEKPQGVTVEKEDVSEILAEVESLRNENSEKSQLLTEALERVSALEKEKAISQLRIELLSTGKEDVFAKDETELDKYILETYDLEKKEQKAYKAMSFEEKLDYAYQLEKNSEEELGDGEK